MILNPTTKDHWIYKEYFKRKNIKDGYTGIVDNVLYIHTSYLDVNPKFVPDNIRKDYADNLAMVVIKVIGRNLYLTDVVFTPEDSTYTEPVVIDMAKENKLEYLWIESNGVGSMYASNIAPSLYSTTVVPYHQSTNKHAKIVSRAGFIKKWMHFRDDYEAGSEYDLFMQNMIEYNKSKKENSSIHDDAIDSLSSAVGFIQEWLYENWL